MNLSIKETKKWHKHWINESNDALKSAEELFISKRYNHALFFAHLAVEKKIKAYFLKKHKIFPHPVHDLLYLFKKSQIKIQPEMLNDLNEINTLNIRARYEDYKRAFYNKATKEYCSEWLNKAKSIINLLQ